MVILPVAPGGTTIHNRPRVRSGFCRAVTFFGLVLYLTALTPLASNAGPFSLHPENPRYFLFGGQPAILITSGEPHVAVLNLDFDCVKYLDTTRGTVEKTENFRHASGGRKLAAPRFFEDIALRVKEDAN